MLINIVCIESSRPDWARQAFESYQSKFNKSISVRSGQIEVNSVVPD